MPISIDNKERFPSYCYYGIHVNRSNMRQMLNEIETLLNSNGRHYVCFIEGNLIYRASHNSSLRNAIDEADLVYSDGIVISLIWGLHFRKVFNRCTGPSAMLQICQYGVEKGWKHFFLGGDSKVSERLVENLKRQFPGLKVVGRWVPPFRPLTDDEEKEIRNRIEETKPDFLWVGLGGAKQEFWMHDHLNKLNVPIMLGVGAAFDFHSQNKPWCPKILRILGLEWLWRGITGGWRIFRRNLRCVSYDIFLLLKELSLFFLPGKKKEYLPPPIREKKN